MTSKKTKEELPLGLWLFCFFNGWGLIVSVIELFTGGYFVGIYATIEYVYVIVQLSLQIITLVLICQRKKSFRISFWSIFFINALLFSLAAYGDPSLAIGLIYKLIIPLFWGAYFQYSKKIRAWGTSPTESSPPVEACHPDPGPMLAMAKSGPDLPSEAAPPLEISPPANEAIEPQSENTSPVLNAIELPPEKISPAIKTTNLPPEKQTHQFCKLCGGALDASKKCTGCGKQYFHINKGHVLKGYAIIVTLLLLSSAGMIISNDQELRNQSDKASTLEQENSDLQKTLQEIENTMDSSPVKDMLLFDPQERIYDFTEKRMVDNPRPLPSYSEFTLPGKIERVLTAYIHAQDVADRLIMENVKMLENLNYLSQRAVFVTEAGQKYHKYDCQHIQERRYFIYNIEAAKGYGYTACADCWK